MKLKKLLNENLWNERKFGQSLPTLEDTSKAYKLKKEEYGSGTIEEGDYEEFFQSAMKKYGISSPDELESDEKKKEFFNYVDKNYKAKSEGKFNEGGPGSGRPSNDEPEEPSDLSDFDPTHDRK